MKIAVIDKQKSTTQYTKYFNFAFDQYHLSSVPKTKILKKDVDISINTDDYDYIILIGAEATKFYTGKSIGSLGGHIVKDKFIPIPSPAMLIFRPEQKETFEKILEKLHDNISGNFVVNTDGEFVGITDTETALSYLEDILKNEEEIVSLDTETTGLYCRNCYVLGISISNGIRKGAYILSDIFDEKCTEILQEIINTKTIVFHNAKFDIQMLQYHFNLKFRKCDTNDTLIVHYLLDETVGSHGLKDLALKYTDYGDYDLDLEVFKKEYCKSNKILEANFTYEYIPFEIIYKYAAQDASVTWELYHLFRKYLQGSILEVYNQIMLPALFLLVDIEGNGIPFNKEKLEFADNYLSNEIKAAKDHLYGLKEIQNFQQEQNQEFNPNSPLQLRKFLFDYLKLEGIGKKTGTGELSTDAEVLENLESEHPAVKSLITLRKLNKIKNTYIDTLLYALDNDGRVRTNFNQTSTTSGRLSSSGVFNAQQIPRDDPIIKGCIEAKEGNVIVSQDLQTAEMYVASVLSGDLNLQDVFKSGKDFHSSIAKKVFRLPAEVEDIKKIHKIERQASKAISFGILYGSGAEKVATTVNKEGGNFSLEDAQETIEDYFDTFKRLARWLKNSKEYIKTHGCIYSIFGRKRRLKDVQSPNSQIAGHAIRSGINFLVQSVASDINLLAAIDLNTALKVNGINAKIIMLVHDSIVAEVKESDVEEYCKLAKFYTQKDRGVSITNCPIGIDQEIGKDYSFGKFDTQYGDLFKEYKVSSISTN